MTDAGSGLVVTSRKIRVLPDHVANRIAAGEVVERPASVVKELLENAIDAGAGRVEILVEAGGRRRIRVADDGSGMGREDALLALERHATSKVAAAEDLAHIRTLGFRGEALPSIGAVSRLTLETHDGQDEVGTRIRVRGGRIDEVEAHPRTRGTTVDVERLFFNTPARAEFMRSASAETRAISGVVSRVAAAVPSVGIRLLSGDRELLDLPPARDLAERVVALWGEPAGELIPVSAEREGWSVRGLIQRPDLTRPGYRRSILLAHGRPFTDRGLVTAVDRGYRTTIPPAHRPWFVIEVAGPAGAIDPNVHPQKEEVRFLDRAQVEELLEGAVVAALDGSESGATFAAGETPLVLQVRESERTDRGSPTQRASKGPDGAGEAQQTTLFVAPSPPPLDSGAGTIAGDGVREGPGDPSQAPASPAGLVNPRLWQVHRTWILAEIGDGLLLIDQHSAHERILYHRIIHALEEAGEAGQRLLFPFTIRLPRDEYGLVESLGGILRRTGFEVELFGGDAVIVHAVPNPHPAFDAERCLREMLTELAEGSELTRSARNQHDKIAMTFACKGAIKAGQVLAEEEMRELVDELFATPLPFHDVHGRPTIVRLSRNELERKFGRH